jgi:hypothetical protein
LSRLAPSNYLRHAVHYLASPFASASTGGALRVDGGYVDPILP